MAWQRRRRSFTEVHSACGVLLILGDSLLFVDQLNEHPLLKDERKMTFIMLLAYFSLLDSRRNSGGKKRKLRKLQIDYS